MLCGKQCDKQCGKQCDKQCGKQCDNFDHCYDKVFISRIVYLLNSTILLHINQPAYFMERNMENIHISRTTQRINTGQVSVCSQEPGDSTDANIVETSTCLKTIR